MVNHVINKADKTIVHINREPKQRSPIDTYHAFDPEIHIHYFGPELRNDHFDVSGTTIVVWDEMRMYSEGVLQVPPGQKIENGNLVNKSDREKAQDGEMSFETYKTIRLLQLRDEKVDLEFRDYTSPQNRTYQADPFSLQLILAELVNLDLSGDNEPEFVEWTLKDNTRPQIPVSEFKADYQAAHARAKAVAKEWADSIRPQIEAAQNLDELDQISFTT